MTNGKLVAKDGSNTLNVGSAVDAGLSNGYWRVLLLGDGDGTRTFPKDDWDFIPEQPSVLEQVQGFPVGTKFKYSDGDLHYLKFSKERIAYWDPAWPDVDGSTLNINTFGDSRPGQLEVIE